MIAGLLALVLLGIAGLHAAWALRATWPAAEETALARMVVGSPGIQRMPSAAACWVVVGALLIVALLMLAKGGWIADPAPGLTSLLLAGSAAIFGIHGIASWIPAWRALCPEEPFATLDRRYYGPLCLALGLGQLAVLT